MNTTQFKRIKDNVDDKLVNNYRGETDIEKVLDLSRFKDDLDGLIIEMVKQPSIYAYWANMRRIAEENFEKYVGKFEVYKASKVKSVVERLVGDGIKHPTGKLVEAKFNEIYGSSEVFKSYTDAISRWRERKDVLSIIEKSVSSRENVFKSLSYLLSSMMNSGLLTNPKKRSSIKPIKESD